MNRDKHGERELRVAQRTQRSKLALGQRGVRLRHRESAIGGEPFEQDRAERLRIVGPGTAGADVAHRGNV